MSHLETTFPLCTRYTKTVICTPRWYVENTEYHPVLCTYQPLINGEEAFKEVHLAIAAATRSVDIICWGFQPSMYFIRDHNSPCIGELLRQKAKEGVRVRVLGWELVANLAGAGGEANLPGRFPYIADMKLQNSTKQQHAYDHEWFNQHSGDPGKFAYGLGRAQPVFVSRGFSGTERARIVWDARVNARDKGLSAKTLGILMLSATHHQKSVLVDYEDPANAVGFVMGHNMLDEYWDTDAHSALNRTQHHWPAPDAGARGLLPRQDISSKVTGPLLEHLHHNFATAWREVLGEDLMKLRQAKKLACDLKCGEGTWQVAQLLRTQAQEGKRDIETVYLQAVNNASQFIYIENQYFRWPPLAEAIKKAAADQLAGKRDPAKHGYLYLFVVTNDTDDGVGKANVNTQRMLECLGRADTIPHITKLQRIDNISVQWRDDEERERKTREIEESTITMEEVPGLKVHVCSLVAKDSPAGKPWTPVYVHSKLMIVDDVFTTHGSANINTRSMQVDSELNIAHEWVSVTTALRRRLWALHMGKAEAEVPDDAKEAFDAWTYILEENVDLRGEKNAPHGALVEFYYGGKTKWDLD
ncbi:phospholipase D-like domain-containing protein [Pseudomonas sp. dw_358]|uniref:phospholipase D-like domain-containing protein n=1 Tax=Pseudomonas sp. dw_358 TaxID=2720083 RepID=UPI001BD5663A|nr:phospholipase D-like domain-containing protein [Pseudomonas sp. dw_358]